MKKLKTAQKSQNIKLLKCGDNKVSTAALGALITAKKQAE